MRQEFDERKREVGGALGRAVITMQRKSLLF